MRLRFIVGKLATALVAVLLPHAARALQAERSTDSSELRIPVGSASLHVRTIGRGQPLIVLHGGPDFDYGYLLPEMDRFKDAFRLIYYDQRGRGRSADHVRPEDVTLASDVNDIDRVRRHFRLDSPALLGHSWGTVLALEYALRYPTRVSHLILMNPAPASANDVAVLRKAYLEKLGAEMDLQRAIVTSTAYQVGDPETVAARYRIHFKPALARAEDYEKLMARMKAGFISQGREGIVKARAVEDQLMRDSWEVPTYDLLPKLRTLSIPTLVITGDQDFIPVEIAERIARAIPNATLVTIRGCGHFTYLECGDEVRAAVDDFFAASTARSQKVSATDEAAIMQLGAAWESAWNRRDASALAALLAEDVDFVTVLGPNGWLKGRARFEQVHTAMFRTYFAESVWKTKEVHVKFLRPDLAIARVLWSTTGDKVRHVKHGSPREGIFTWVVEKRAGKWVIVAAQNTEVMPVLAGQ